MWYPEEPITYCRACDEDIPVENIWRGRGFIITNGGKEVRTLVLYSVCAHCGRRLSVGLDGPLWYRTLHGWFWRLRYPNTRRPEGLVVYEERRRASG
jgi:hypothetical protein